MPVHSGRKPIRVNLNYLRWYSRLRKGRWVTGLLLLLAFKSWRQ